MNSSYRMADHLRWKKEDFILGFDVKLSEQHPQHDICDELQGRYPKDFVFTGWHPQCFCLAEPVRMEKKDFIDKLNGKDIDFTWYQICPEASKNGGQGTGNVLAG